MKKIIGIMVVVVLFSLLSIPAYANRDISGVWIEERFYPPGEDDTYYRIRKFGDEFFAEPFRKDNVIPMPVTYRIKLSGNTIEAMVTEDLGRTWANGRTFTHVASGSLSADGSRIQLEYMSTMPTGAIGNRVEGWQDIPVTIKWIKVE